MPDWDVSNVKNMNAAFADKLDFNADIGSWDVSGVTDMSLMFEAAAVFNQDIGMWDVSSVEYMSGMFSGTENFNQDIGSWDVSGVEYMNEMFSFAISFNQDIGMWDVSSVMDMSYMFSESTSFNQDIGTWDVSSATDMSSMFDWSGLTTETYDLILKGWPAQNLKSNVNFGANVTSYCIAEAERQNIIEEFNWSITDAGLYCSKVNALELEHKSLKVFPSPTIGPVSIEFENPERGVLKIYGPTGRLLQSLKVDESDRLNYELDGMPGIYLVEFLNETGAVFVEKVLKVD